MTYATQDIREMWKESLLRYGYLGVFIFSMISNSIPYATVPYILVIILLARNTPSSAERTLLIFLSATGAVLGKMIVYFMGYGLSTLVSTSKLKPVLDILRRSRSAFIATIVFASLPLPDDILYIPLGAIKYDFKRYVLALFIGKFIMTYIAVNLGLQTYWLLEQVAGLSMWVSIPIMIILTLYVLYILTNINWNLIIEIGAKKSFIYAFFYMIYEMLLKTVTLPIRIYRLLKHKCSK